MVRHIGRPQLNQPLSAASYAAISLIALLCAFGFTILYVYYVPGLVSSGVGDRIFYLLLIPWGLASAVFLFGAMRSYARLVHRRSGGLLEMGGPAVLFVLVVVGGFKLVPPPPQYFDLTVRPFEEKGGVPRLATGNITIDLGTRRETEPIGRNGEAIFKDVPASFEGRPVPVLTDVEGYESSWQTCTISKHLISLPLRHSVPRTTTLTGTLIPAPRDNKQVTILVEGQEGRTMPDEFGRFTLPVTGNPGDRVRFVVYDRGKLVYYDYQTLPGPISLRIQ